VTASQLAPSHRVRALAERALRASWLAVVPVLLAIAALKYLVPAEGTETGGAVARLARARGLEVGVGLFLVLSTLARYWLSVFDRRRVRPVARRPRWTDAAAGIALVGAVAGARAVVVRTYALSGESMLPTLEAGDRVAGYELPYRVGSPPAPRRGQVVVFRSDVLGGLLPVGPGATEPPGLVVKRVIGLPGDRIEMRGSTPVINEWQVPTCDAGQYLHVVPDGSGHSLPGRLKVEFLDDVAYLAVHAGSLPPGEPYEVKPGEVFVLGDDRQNSLDSRAYGAGHGGGVPVAAIEARVMAFLFGTHPSGDLDASRFLRTLASLQTRVHLEGMQTDALEEGVARCLRQRPASTSPPPPADAAAIVDARVTR